MLVNEKMVLQVAEVVPAPNRGYEETYRLMEQHSVMIQQKMSRILKRMESILDRLEKQEENMRVRVRISV